MADKRGRGRPVGSSIRQNLVEILFFKSEAYGYELYRDYCDIFPPATMRVIYYHLKKGLATGEFKIKRIKTEKGDYSWGGTAEKKYYSLGPMANPRADKRVKEYYDKKQIKNKQKTSSEKKQNKKIK